VKFDEEDDLIKSCGVSDGNNSLIDMEEELEREKQEIRDKVNAKYPRVDNASTYPGLHQVRDTPDFPIESSV
jgi:hypothetical protein